MGGVFSRTTQAQSGKVDKNEQIKANKVTGAKSTKLEPKPHQVKKKDLIKQADTFEKIDKHARSAPEHLRGSLPDLVNYLIKPSKDPLYRVRAFFVWIAKNIRYDTEGYFGRAEMAKCNSQSVILTGRSVCEGYANVMEEMCKQIGIPVKKISGFAKGFEHSLDSQLTTETKTNHAWNAVYIRGHWFLLDSTWGAGHLNRETNQYKAEFNEFFFLADPEHLIYTHFPFQEGNIKESQKWQLLKKPFSLERFNSTLKIKSASFNIGLLPSSHKDTVITFSDELNISFIEETPKTTVFRAKLYKKEGNTLYEENYCCYGYWSNKSIKIKVKPQTSGTYRLKIFGNVRTNENNELSELFEYVLNCTVSSKPGANRSFPYPEAYTRAYIDECQVLEPLGKCILPKTNVCMRFKSPYLSRMMVNQQKLARNGEVFEGTVTTPESRNIITVYGSRSDSGHLDAQYKFCVS